MYMNSYFVFGLYIKNVKEVNEAKLEEKLK